MIEQVSGPPMLGVRQHASGLYVPEELSRPREVWTHDEQRLLNRVSKLLASRGIRMLLACVHPDCRQAGPIEKVTRLDGGLTLRCAHLDREFQPR